VRCCLRGAASCRAAVTKVGELAVPRSSIDLADRGLKKDPHHAEGHEGSVGFGAGALALRLVRPRSHAAMPRRAAHFADSHGDVGSATKCAPRNKNPGKLCRVPAHLSLVPHTFSHLRRAFRLFQSTQDDAEDRPPSPPQPSDSSLYESTPDVVVPPLDMSTLASRMRAIQESESVQQRLEALPCAWVLVFDADTEEEAVYSMEMDSEQHVVLAFEDREEAEQYALSLRDSPEELGQPHLAGYESLASVQGLDVEALVVTSRDADFKVGVVFKGDLIPVDPPSSSSSLGGVETRDTAPDTVPPFITGFPSLDAGLAEVGASSAGPRVAVSITMVPDACFEGRTADDFLDPAEDPVWVLIHDEVRTSHSLWQRERESRFFSYTLPSSDALPPSSLLFLWCRAPPTPSSSRSLSTAPIRWSASRTPRVPRGRP
jgi:hypothetical protein